MKVNVYIQKQYKSKTVSLKDKAKASDLLTSLNINPVTIIITKDNELIQLDTELNNNDNIKILSVISGG